MEDNTLSDGWSWIDEDLGLDAEFPLAMSHCFMDDTVDNEAVVRSLFPSRDSHDCNPAPLKRRRMLEFDDENSMEVCSYIPEPQETSEDFLVEVCENLQIVDPSHSSSVWYMANEESLSPVDDTKEQSPGSWRVGYISDSDANDVPELVHLANNPPFKVSSKAISEKASELVRQTLDCTISNAHCTFPCFELNKRMNSPGSVRIKKAGQHRRGQFLSSKECLRPVFLKPSEKCSSPVSIDTRKECPSAVLAYPFALVKPIGIQGDITLQDINQRINTTHCRVKT